jgi:menaquinone-specific isochorismate synthase
MDRGRYAGPVGWMDASGDGEWGIALRSAELDGDTVRLFAGCGIVADSDPEAELAEAQAKFVPVRDALNPMAVMGDGAFASARKLAAAYGLRTCLQ